MSSSSKRSAPRQVPAPRPGLDASPHARFIPREELMGYTSWTPGALGPAAQPASTQPLKSHLQAKPLASTRPGFAPSPDLKNPTATTLDAAAPARSHLDSAVRDIDLESLQQAARQAGYHDGYRDGLAALDNFKRSFAQQMATQVGQLMSSMDSELKSVEADMAQAIVQAATGLARQIVRSELTTRPELVTQVARQAVAALSQSVRRIEMRVHPDDLALVQAGLGEEAAARGVTCIGDADISRGGCSLQTELGSVDARIEHQWELALRRSGQDASQWPLHTHDQF